MNMIGNLAAEDVATYIDFTSKVMAAAKECGCDTWAVIQLSPRKAALVTGSGLNLVPDYETVIARKDFDSEPLYFI
jgi:hypothetical protein